MRRRGRLGALAVLGFASFIETTACSSATDTGADGTGGLGGFVGGTGATPPVGGIGNTGNLPGTGNATSQGGTGNTGNSPGTGNATSQGGTGNTGNSPGTGNAPGAGGLIGAGGAGGAAGSVGVGGSGETAAAGAAGAAGNAGAGGAAGAPNTGGSAGMVTKTPPPCLSSGAQGTILGDSYVTGALSPALQPALGALIATANSYRNYAVAGTSMATGGATGLIPPQLVTALTMTTKFGIQDGGGNDILICDAGQFPGCAAACTSAGSSSNTMCKTIVDKATAAAKKMMTDAAAGGIHDVIYFFYPHIPSAGSGGAGYAEILDYAEPIAKDTCGMAAAFTSGKLNCYFVDLVQPFKAAGGDKNAANFAADGIHPSQAGQNIIAKELFAVMKANCVGMTAADAMKNGCTCAM